MAEWSYSSKHIFFMRHTATFLGTIDSMSVLHLGDILNSKITSKKLKKCKKKSDINTPLKGHLFLVSKLKQERRAQPCSASARNMCIRWLKFFITLFMSMNDAREPWVMILRLQMLFVEQVNSQMRNAQIMRTDCISISCSLTTQPLPTGEGVRVTRKEMVPWQ